jgi:hypothetical protein
MTTPKGPEDVTRPIAPSPLGEGEGGRLPAETARSFQSYMKTSEPSPLLSTGKPIQVSPFELAQGQVLAAGPTFNTIQAQAKAAQSSLGDVATQLNTPNLKLRQSSKYILKNKLASANGLIRSASAKLGAPEQAQSESPAGAGPLQRFLSLVTDGQNQLQAAQDQLAMLQEKGTELTPGDMLLVQIKLNKAQQEIEYSSLLLSKAVDDMKMMMNIQL